MSANGCLPVVAEGEVVGSGLGVPEVGYGDHDRKSLVQCIYYALEMQISLLISVRRPHSQVIGGNQRLFILINGYYCGAFAQG